MINDINLHNNKSDADGNNGDGSGNGDVNDSNADGCSKNLQKKYGKPSTGENALRVANVVDEVLKGMWVCPCFCFFVFCFVFIFCHNYLVITLVFISILLISIKSHNDLRKLLN